MKIAVILGTRPEIIKTAPVITECLRRSIPLTIIHSDQHYDPDMDAVFFQQLNLPSPSHRLSIKQAGPASKIGQMIIGLEEALTACKPNCVLVQGDTNTVLAGALTAQKAGIDIGHIEAGLRSYDLTMPEEINRLIVDRISSHLFCPTEKQKKILLGEKIPRDKIYVTGNTVVDATLKYADIAARNSVFLEKLGLKTQKFLFLTCHRPSNTDNAINLREILSAVSQIAQEEQSKVVFPVHPRLRPKLDAMEKFPNFILLPPVGYLESLLLQQNANMIFTDSGGIQEEACVLRKKCLILRTNTERPETLEVGGAEILPQISLKEIKATYLRLKKKKVIWKNPFGDGNAAQKIVDILSGIYA